MNHKEVLGAIDVDGFMVAADSSIEKALRIDHISNAEKKQATIAFKGLAKLACYLRGYHNLIGRRAEGRSYETGVIRQVLATEEWFQTQFTEGYGNRNTNNTYLWLKNIDSVKLRYVMRSYLQQEKHEDRLHENTGAELVLAEAELLEAEYPAFAALPDLLEARLLEQGANELEADDIARGAYLGGIALREYIETTIFKQQVPFVYRTSSQS